MQNENEGDYPEHDESGTLRPPEVEATPQVPSSTASIAEPASIVSPIEQHLQYKRRILTQGHLSEIGEEPNILSTEQNLGNSVEPEISRISSNASYSGM